jgi:hypothetical protein
MKTNLYKQKKKIMSLSIKCACLTCYIDSTVASKLVLSKFPNQIKIKSNTKTYTKKPTFNRKTDRSKEHPWATSVVSYYFKAV